MTLDLDVLREGWDFEAKKAAGRDGRGALPENFWETYSAMANTNGGTIVLGVGQREDGTFEVLGIEEPDRLERDLWNLLRDRHKVSVDLLKREDVRLETAGGKTVLVITMPRAERHQRPVYIKGNPITGTYIRTHEGDRRCTEEEVRRMLADADREHPRDSEVVRGYGVDDLDSDTLKTYRNLLKSRKADHPFLGQDGSEFLGSIRAWRRDRESGGDGLTLAGLLVLGKEGAIRDRFPHFHLDYRALAGDDVVGSSARWIDRVFPDGTWAANLLQFYLRVKPKLDARVSVPFRLSEPDLFRRDETHVHEAIREAFVNALIHADYTATTGIRIFRHPDGFEFVNPGTLLLPVDQIRRGGVSECRNPSIQHLLGLIGMGEKAGSGFPAIRRAWGEQHWRSPHLEEDLERSETRLHLAMLSLFPAEVMAALERLFGAHFRTLPEDGRLAIATAYAEGRVTNRRLQDLSDRHPRDWTLLLGDLVANGLLEPHAEGRARWYTVAGAGAVVSAAQTTAKGSQQSIPQTIPQSSGAIPLSIPQIPEAKSVIYLVARSKWLPRPQVEAAILELCLGHFVTVEEIAERLRRARTTIQENYVSPLVREGKLAMRFPDQPRHPEQAYRTVDHSKR